MAKWLLEFFRKPLSTKEVVIVLGVFLLLTTGIAGAMVLRTPPKAQTLPVFIPPKVTESLNLILASPAENSIITDGEVAVKGKTLPNTAVIFFTESSENSVESDQNGDFEGKIDLASGINTLTVTAFAENGEEKSIAFNLVYDDQVKGAKEPPGQVKKGEESRKAVVGQVEKVTPNSVVVEEKKANRKVETTVDKNTKIVGQDKKVFKIDSLKKEDLVAIIATDSGLATDGGRLKKAVKIFVIQPGATVQTKRRAISGIISSISGKMITLTHQIQTDRVYQFYFSDQTVIKIKGVTAATAADLTPGLRIAAVADSNGSGQLVAKMIHVIPGKATGVFQKTPLATPSASLTPSITFTPSATPTPLPTEMITITPSPTP